MVGAIVGLLVFTPFAAWRHNHAMHHATAGDLDRRGVGDLPTMTVEEYTRKPGRCASRYRLFRNPIVMFGIGWIWGLLVQPRLVSRDARPRIQRSVHLTNLVLIVIVAGLCLLIGWKEFLLIQGPTAVPGRRRRRVAVLRPAPVRGHLLGAARQLELCPRRAPAASSYLKLPQPLQFFTANIGLHHVHHLNARMPNYNLQRAHDENPVFHSVPTLRSGTG